MWCPFVSVERFINPTYTCGYVVVVTALNIEFNRKNYLRWEVLLIWWIRNEFAKIEVHVLIVGLMTFWVVWMDWEWTYGINLDSFESLESFLKLCRFFEELYRIFGYAPQFWGYDDSFEVIFLIYRLESWFSGYFFWFWLEF